MSSLRKPKRITIRGDDEREYMFLVKGGEDLRVDQRIEQASQICAGCSYLYCGHQLCIYQQSKNL